ncbi:hypothetical protein ABI59_07395 [Acidobacteria bacterium Mor1]|nr:hypothetical protein ABI59_07395 [Acidobacteria bacterium Mor1]
MSKLRGRFGEPTGDDMQRFSSSIEIDLEMLDEDIDGTRAHVTMLAEAGMLGDDEAARLLEGLEHVRAELRAGSWVPGDELEDIHMAVEARLVERLGEPAKKVHTARSRNDQVATDVRLWLRRNLQALSDELGELLSALLSRAESDGDVLMAGYTHLQRGQPILLGHLLLAHAWPVSRDRQRVADALTRIDLNPLGACAMAGTPHPIRRERTTELLGFGGMVENAMDAVAARDHEQEVAALCAIVAGHLSRMAEELVLWSSTEFGFVRLSERYATGSSIMPQKRNPDAAELLRGRSARIQAGVTGLLSLCRALPMAYNRDLQETRELLFQVVSSTRESVRIATGVWNTLSFRRDRFEQELRGDFSLATEVADWLASRGVPFREAHEVSGRMVRHCDEQGTDLSSLSPEAAADFHPLLAEADRELWIDPRAAAERRTSRGGTASAEIRRQIGLLRATTA